MGNHLSTIFNGPPDTGEYHNDCIRTISHIHKGDRPITWTTLLDCLRSRLKVHVQMVARNPPYLGYQDTNVHFLPSANGRNNGTCESFDRSDTQSVRRVQSERLGQVPSTSGVCDKLYHQQSNRDGPVRNQLRLLASNDARTSFHRTHSSRSVYFRNECIMKHGCRP
jgi:hypothetical protein